MKQLWLKILQKLTEQTNGTFLMLSKRINFEINKKSLKSKDDNNISSNKSIKFRKQYTVGL